MTEAKGPIRFGVFEADLMSRTLRKRGVRIRLQELPFRLLAMLLARPGEVVTREELKNELWAEEDYGEFDLGLNTAVKKLRQALDDSANTPRFIETIPKVGYRFIGSAASAQEEGEESKAAAAGHPVVVQRSSLRALQVLAAVLGAALLGLSVAYLEMSAPDAPRKVRKFSFSAEGLRDAHISPDGRYIVFTATAEGGGFSLWLRSLDSETVRELPGTQGAVQFLGGWSLDSRSILFAAGGQLKRVAIDGGEPAVLCALPVTQGRPFSGAAYSLDSERIVFSSGMQLWEIPARGGKPEPLFEKDAGSYWGPQFLPKEGGGRYLIYAVFSAGEFRTELFDSGTGERRTIAPGRDGVYDPSGFVIHGRGEANAPGLLAMPFSPATLSATGPSFYISDRGYRASVSREGTLVFVGLVSGEASGRIVVRDRSGEIVKSIDDPIRGWSMPPQISPEGTRVALRADSAIWVYDLNRGSRHRLSSGPNLHRPSWTSSGDEVVFVDQAAGLMIQAADGSADAAVWLDSSSAFGPVSFSSDGRYAAYGDFASDGQGGIWYREAGPDGSWSDPIPWLVTPASENQPQFSPDGRYLAYRSDESGPGRSDVWVRPFPEGQEKWPVSTNGGQSARWSRAGGELFYLNDGVLLSVPVSTADRFTAGVPRRLFEWPDRAPGSFAVFPDGERFLAIEVDQPEVDAVRIIENWYEEFRGQQK